MVKSSVRRVLVVLVLLAGGLLSATPGMASCQKCKFFWGVGTICVDVTSGGNEGCSDTDTCGVYGPSCGSGGQDCGDHCVQDPE